MIFGICWGFDDSLGASLPDGFHRICDAWNGLLTSPGGWCLSASARGLAGSDQWIL